MRLRVDELLRLAQRVVLRLSVKVGRQSFTVFEAKSLFERGACLATLAPDKVLGFDLYIAVRRYDDFDRFRHTAPPAT